MPDPVAAVVSPTALAHSIEETLDLVPIGRSTLYKLIGTGELRTVTIARRRLVPHSALVALIEGTPDARPA